MSRCGAEWPPSGRGEPTRFVPAPPGESTRGSSAKPGSEQKITRGWRSLVAREPSPSRSMTPGRKFSITTSAEATRSRAIARSLERSRSRSLDDGQPFEHAAETLAEWYPEGVEFLGRLPDP